jgi:hypothetical protein
MGQRRCGTHIRALRCNLSRDVSCTIVVHASTDFLYYPPRRRNSVQKCRISEIHGRQLRSLGVALNEAKENSDNNGEDNFQRFLSASKYRAISGLRDFGFARQSYRLTVVMSAHDWPVPMSDGLRAVLAARDRAGFL